jgi:hypothetical protein
MNKNKNQPLTKENIKKQESCKNQLRFLQTTIVNHEIHQIEEYKQLERKEEVNHRRPYLLPHHFPGITMMAKKNKKSKQQSKTMNNKTQL